VKSDVHVDDLEKCIQSDYILALEKYMTEYHVLNGKDAAKAFNISRAERGLQYLEEIAMLNTII
jgi:hypothetical protein